MARKPNDENPHGALPHGCLGSGHRPRISFVRAETAASLPRLPSTLRQHLRPEPAARYVHPRALSAPDSSEDYTEKLDVADESSPNYLSWIAELIRPYLGGSVLELGAGIGSITARYASGRSVVAMDLSDECIQTLNRRFADCPNVTVVKRDLRELGDDDATYDSIVMVNVLEHIEDDAGVLGSLPPLLASGGHIVIYVPALNGLYGRWDRDVGHYRRYSKWRMRGVAREASLDVVDLRYVNALAIPAWVAFSRTDVDRRQRDSLSLWDRTGVPLSRAIESRIRLPLGLNLLAVLRPGA